MVIGVEVVVLITMREVQARKKQRYKRENFGGTSDATTHIQAYLTYITHIHTHIHTYIHTYNHA